MNFKSSHSVSIYIYYSGPGFSVIVLVADDKIGSCKWKYCSTTNRAGYWIFMILSFFVRENSFYSSTFRVCVDERLTESIFCSNTVYSEETFHLFSCGKRAESFVDFTVNEPEHSNNGRRNKPPCDVWRFRQTRNKFYPRFHFYILQTSEQKTDWLQSCCIHFLYSKNKGY